MLARFSQLITSCRTVIVRHWPTSRAGSFLSFVGLGIVVLGILGVASPTHAIFTDIFNGIMHAFSWIMFILARLFIGMTIFFLKFFIEVAKYNNFIDTSTVKVGWFLVRDVANMFFVVILLVISFGTILGIEQYEWKKTLVKLILAAIFINFSNMISQLIIDAAHVFTITFVNAISATAGGNLIRMFNIESVYQITGAEKFGEGSDLKLETFAASVTVFFLAFFMMATIGAYALVMVARMVVLWVLIILSPLAYIFQVLPQTQKYAQEWWSTFINHVIVAPVMVFFLWLSFATLNDKSHNIQVDQKSTAEATQAVDGGVDSGEKKLSISEASSWENMANYIIALAFLLVGLRKVRELGVEAGGLTSSIGGAAKKIGMIASGVGLGIGAYKAVSKMSADKAKEVFVQPVKDVGKRVKQDLDKKRIQTPYLRRIPLLGLTGKLRKEKLNEESDRNYNYAKENYIDTISRQENASKVDKFGWWMKQKTGVGFGLTKLKKSRYDLQGQQDVIQKDKAAAAKTRVAKAETKFTEQADAAMEQTGITEQLETQEKEAFDGWRNHTDNAGEYGDVGDEWVAQNFNDAAQKEEAEKQLDREVDRTLDEEFHGTQDGARMQEQLQQKMAALQNATKVFTDETKQYAKALKEYTTGLAKEGHILKKDLTQEDQAKVDAHIDKNPGVSENQAIATLFAKDQITLDDDQKGIFHDAFRDTDEGRAAAAQVETATQARTDAQTASDTTKGAYTDAKEKFRKPLREEKKKELLGERSFEDRIEEVKTEKVEAENKKRKTAAEAGFATSDEAKKLAEKSEKAIFQLADDIAKGKVKIKKTQKKKDRKGNVVLDEDGKPVMEEVTDKMDMQKAQGVASKLREKAKGTLGKKAEAKLGQADAELDKSVLGTQFGQFNMLMTDMADRAKALAEAFQESFKNEKVGKQLKKAGDLIAKKLETGGQKAGSAMQKSLDKALQKNVYVRALQEAEILKKTSEAKTLTETKASESAKALAVEMPEYGISTPSTSLIPLAERLATDLKTQEAPDAADFAVKQLAHLLLKKKENGEIDDHQQAFLMGTAMHVGRNGWFDDVISEAATKFTQLKERKFDGDEHAEERESIQNLQDIFVDQLGIVSRDGDGFSKISDTKQIADLQSLMVNGGDTDHIMDHTNIETVMAAAQADKEENGDSAKGVDIGSGKRIIADDSYKTVLGEMGKAGKLLSGSAEGFERKLKDSAEALQEASSFFKREAMNTGHQEYGAHHQYDSEMGMYRMATQSEASVLMAAETRKFKGKTKWQYHGLGKADVDAGKLLKIDSRYFNNQFEELDSAMGARIIPERTIDAISGYDFGKKGRIDDQGFGLIGDSLENMEQHWGGVEEYLGNSIIPALRGNAEAFKYIMRQKFQNVEAIQSNRGLAKLKIEGTDISGTTYSQFLQSILDSKHTQSKLTPKDREIIEDAIKASQEKEQGLRGGDAKKKPSKSENDTARRDDDDAAYAEDTGAPE